MHDELVQGHGGDLDGRHLHPARARHPLPRGRLRQATTRASSRFGRTVRHSGSRCCPLRAALVRFLRRRGPQPFGQAHEMVEQAGDGRVRAGRWGVESRIGYAREQVDDPAGGGFEIGNGHVVVTGATARTHRSSSPRQGSRPTVRPGRSRTCRTASSTPGMNERAVHRVVPDRQRLPVGAEHDLLVGDQPGQPDRVHPDPVDLGAAGAGQLPRGGVGRRPEPGLGPGRAISAAVRMAVPDGASTFPAWCSSITSTDSKNRAACRANCMASTAPMPKLGATSTCPGVSASQPATVASPRRRTRWCRPRRRSRGRARTARGRARRRDG